MPASLNSLTSQQKQTLAYMIAGVVALVLAGLMFFDGSRKRAEAATALSEIEQKEIQALSLQFPTNAEIDQWLQQEQDLQKLLMPDSMVPEFYQEVAKLAGDNKLQRYVVNTDEKVMDANASPAPDETKLLSLGIKRYLVMTLTFKGDYADIARFLGQVKALQRPLRYKTINIRRNPPDIDVSMTMQIFKKEGA